MAGSDCNAPHYVPDVFLMSIILFMGTFLLSVELKDFKNALFFPSKVNTTKVWADREEFLIKIIFNFKFFDIN